MNTRHTHSGQTHEPIDRQVERELADALGDQDVQELLAGEAPSPTQDPTPTPSTDKRARGVEHQLVRGRIAAVHGDDVFVDLRGVDDKYQGIVPLGQFERAPRVGSVMDFVVQRIDTHQGLVILSREGAAGRAAWDQLHRGSVVEARVTATNKGGLELEIAGSIRAFMPVSQVDLHYVDDLQPFVGQKLRAQVQEIHLQSKKIVLNRRSLLQSERRTQQERLWGLLEVGQTRQGTVSGVMDYGIFVDLGGIDGLVHVRDMSYDRTMKPVDVAVVGQAVTVRVLNVDRENKRISLGMKQVQPDPWQGIADHIHVGDQLSARVVRTVEFGAFMQLGHGLEGLVHISELAEHRVHNVDDVVQVGQECQCRVIAVNEKERRIRLSLKTSAAETADPTQRQPLKAAMADHRRSKSIQAQKKPPKPLKGGIE